MYGHVDTVTGTELSPDGSYLLTTGMDNTGLYCLLENPVCLHTHYFTKFTGHTKTAKLLQF